jgi:phage N-6-adenine-methyltransferase
MADIGACLSSGSDAWETPGDLFAAASREFGPFMLDAAATYATRKASAWFGPGSPFGADALTVPTWAGYGSAWLNPPYSQLGPFMERACREAEAGLDVVCLVPARPETRWFWRYASRGLVLFIDGRVQFLAGGKPGANTAPFPSCLVVLRGGLPSHWAAMRLWGTYSAREARAAATAARRAKGGGARKAQKRDAAA